MDDYGPGNVCCIVPAADDADQVTFEPRPVLECQSSGRRVNSPRPASTPFRWPDFEAEFGCTMPPTDIKPNTPCCCVSTVDLQTADIIQESRAECVRRPNHSAETWFNMPQCDTRTVPLASIGSQRPYYGTASEGAARLFVFTAIAVCFLVLFTCLYFGTIMLLRTLRGAPPQVAPPDDFLANMSSPVSREADSVDIADMQSVDEHGNPVVLVVLPDESVHIGVVNGDMGAQGSSTQANGKGAASAG